MVRWPPPAQRSQPSHNKRNSCDNCRVATTAEAFVEQAQAMLEPRRNLVLAEKMARYTAGDPEFFVRKAIGWALRQHEKRDGAAVRAFVHPELSPLSRREALKHSP